MFSLLRQKRIVNLVIVVILLNLLSHRFLSSDGTIPNGQSLHIPPVDIWVSLQGLHVSLSLKYPGLHKHLKWTQVFLLG